MTKKEREFRGQLDYTNNLLRARGEKPITLEALNNRPRIEEKKLVR
jgi:hypothetical protein